MRPKNIFKILSPIIVIFIIVIAQDFTKNEFLHDLYYEIAETISFSILLLIFFWKIKFVRYPVILVLIFGTMKLLFKSLNSLELEVYSYSKFFVDIFDYIIISALIFISISIYKKSELKISKIMSIALILVFILSYPVLLVYIARLSETLYGDVLNLLIDILYISLITLEILFPSLFILLLLIEEKNYKFQTLN